MKEDDTTDSCRDPGVCCSGVFLVAEERHDKTDELYLKRALGLAARGGRTHPNPAVGAVLVADGEVVGEGYHRGPGTAHAEVVALAQARERSRGATLYVTLEPCSHFGRTPPCTRAIMAAGVNRVVIGLQDPNPVVNGSGIAELRQAGLDVVVANGSLREAAREQNAPFVKAVATGLPLVTCKAAVSLDGKVAAASGDARWISSAESRRRVHAMRARADAVLVGAGTVRRDDPRLTVRDVAGDDPVRVVATRGGELPPTARLVRTARETPTVVLAETVSEAATAALRERGVEVVAAGPEAGLHGMLAALAQRGLFDVLCEGGPTLAGALLRAGLIDRVALFVAPLIVGHGAPELFGIDAAQTIEEALRLHDVSWEPSGPDMLLKARVTRW